MSIYRYRIIVRGIVQGVGFRPFIYRTATNNNLTGWVRNTNKGVEIEVEGDLENLNSFEATIKENPPPLARVNRLRSEEIKPEGDKQFTIRESSNKNNNLTMLPPDVATCEDCLDDINDINNHRYQYPFTNCTNCGPRFSIIKNLPYDRPETTMVDFEMCNKCYSEYHDPADRRFHAQPNACPDCGPEVWLTDNQGKEFEAETPIQTTQKLLKEGKIIAIKGLGGFHLFCDATNPGAISRLRKRKNRPHKPFAMMMKNTEIVKKYCEINQIEQEILEGIKKPILLLNKKEGLPNIVAPGSKSYGVMLPYTPLHYLLFENDIKVLIATSGNLSGDAIEYKNQRALNNLQGIADYFLLHNREIYLPVEDSVTKIIMGKECIIRRARGYVPCPVRVFKESQSLALGAEQKNTICIQKGEYAFLSQHLGDLDNPAIYENFKFTVDHFKKIYDITPGIIAHDLHPGYLSSQYAEKMGNQVGIQHHHAHIASCLAENESKERVIGLAFDGTGLGTDGKVWGGEFLLADLSEFTRVGHLNYFRMPGGEMAIREPWRLAVSYLSSLGYGGSTICELTGIESNKINFILEMLRKDINCIETSSLGRLFDIVASLIDLRREVTYRGQAAIELEEICRGSETGYYNYSVNRHGKKLIVNTDSLIEGIIRDYVNKESCSVIAAKFHNTVIDFSLFLCRKLSNRFNINRVVLSGGVFQNQILLEGIFKGLIKDNFSVYTHSKIPCNDGGIALGQLVIANSLKGGKK